MTYKQYILQFKNEDSAIGDLAYDISKDPDFPDSEDYDDIYMYLRRRNACDECLEVAEETFNDFKSLNA